MAAFSAALFATGDRPDNHETSLIAYALLFEGSKPFWELHMQGEHYLVFADPEHILDDGIWMLYSLCNEFRTGAKAIMKAGEIFETCNHFDAKAREEKHREAKTGLVCSGIHLQLINFPGSSLAGQEKAVEEIKEDSKRMTDMLGFIQELNKEA